ncbi:MAG: hypothetical protein AAB268_13925 [Elusimicrobiota bacterium]
MDGDLYDCRLPIADRFDLNGDGSICWILSLFFSQRRERTRIILECSHVVAICGKRSRFGHFIIKVRHRYGRRFRQSLRTGTMTNKKKKPDEKRLTE